MFFAGGGGEGLRILVRLGRREGLLLAVKSRVRVPRTHAMQVG